MISEGIKIRWQIGYEFISINFNSLSNLANITETIETRKGSCEIVRYYVKTSITRTNDGEFKISLKYEKQLNPHLIEDDLLFGTSTVYINKNLKKGKAEWIGEYSDEYDGMTEWVKVNLGLSKKIIKRKTKTIVRKNQQRLRNAILEIDKVCLISGESLESTLDVAHIISSSTGGSEVLNNSVLMRADIHRLFDTNYFQFCPDGKVKILKELSSYYENLLHNKSIPINILNRIKEALNRM